ncbi:MAG: radical SAM protein [Candidatus Omnitrophica bacterium]|nr:radical SAM protein [Candidatus Omnitrophota bacterium]
MPTRKVDSKLHKIRDSAKILKESLERCSICPRRCGINRIRGERGYCRAGLQPAVYSHSPHHGEEPPLSGTRGSGTIFFTYCNMKCAYCQNYYFSQLGHGVEISIEKLSEIMLGLEKHGCHNINLVSPTHFVPQIVMALEMAVGKGLDIPIVYNSGGYDLPRTLRLLEGIVDIYMPDMRYSDDNTAKKYSDAEDYVKYNRGSVMEMQRQVGDLLLDENGIAEKGLIVRLLALPQELSGIKESLKFIKDRVSGNAYLSIMSQYYPTYKAYDFKELSRGVTKEEYKNVVDEAKRLGLNNGWIQERPRQQDVTFLGTNIKPKREI